MANNLPDEIISEILSPALRVSDAAFSTLSTSSSTSPFMKFSESTSAYLVVSKAWLRVATPLLYHDVILRSKAQAQALAATLAANPALGQFIKKLRVEGGYAISMHKILQNSRNITDLFLSMAIASSDNATGLCRGLPLLDPVRVIIDFGRPWTTVWKSASKLLDTLDQCIPTWEKMTVLEIPSHLKADISEVLAEAPNLETLVVWHCHEEYLHRVPSCIRIMATNPSLKRIRIEAPMLPQNKFQPDFYAEVKRDGKLRALIDLVDESLISADGAPPPSPSTPFVYPSRLTANPVQEDSIWSRVLYFALYRDPTELRHWTRDERPSRLAPILTCKRFARLGVPHLFTSPAISLRAMRSFASQLASKPELGSCVRSLYINPHNDMTEFKKIIACTTALTELHALPHSGRPITWKAFRDIGESTGATLRAFHGISVSKASSPVDSKVLALFSQMREFSWDSGTVFKTAPKSIQADSFSLLVDLTVNAFHASFLKVLSHMELPSLCTVVFPAAAVGGTEFFRKHGAKLQEMTLSSLQLADPALEIWRNCPSVTVLGVSCDDKHPASAFCLQTPDISAHLERIVFRITPHYRLKQAHQTALGDLMLSLNSTASFPALREIEHPSCHWPTMEPEISKSQWVKWAESLHERDIHLVGPDGVRWRPRLKFVPKGKQ
ncbi:hypothetical protein B0H12DRAFT_1229232 [Mycena haematopus]|nr:hypothetical protein B0H12DRAFT_1229232 [Mycena haematopus]